MPASLLRQPNIAILVALVWLLVALALLLQYWAQTAETLLDTDDAMRLVQMRAWLDGPGLLGGWFDMHATRLQPPEGYDSHWSRLIDAGLAGLYWIFRWFADAGVAERLMRVWWPLLWLLPTIAGMTAIAWRIAGREAATVALLLALVGVPAYQQFTPGRIDHHNVQIALTLLVAAAVAWSDRARWIAMAAGALSGLALAIGFESLPYLVVCGAMLALRSVADPLAARALRDYGLALAASSAAAFMVSVPPWRWETPACDAIAINGAAATMCAGLVLALAGRLAHPQALTRALAVAGAGCLALAVFLLIEPRCIRGPFATVEPGIWPVWHDHVRELQPLWSVIKSKPLTAAGIAAFPAAVLLATAMLATDVKLRRNFGFLTAVAVFLAAAGTTWVAIRGYSYAMWLGMPLMAALAPRVFAVLRLRLFAAKVAAGLMLTPMAVSAGAITVAHASGFEDGESFARPESRHCIMSASYAALAGLPRGLVVTDVSYGPYVLALTPHSVMSAPYHRLSRGIVNAHRAMASAPEEARRILVQSGASYVMTCGPRPPDGLAEPARNRSLWGRLQAGDVPGWLEPVPAMHPLAVYRLRS